VILFFMSLLVMADGPDVNLVRAKLKPFDFQDPDQIPMSAVSQVESDGKHLYLRSFRDPWIAVIDRAGKLIARYGGEGEHPGEFRGGAMALALNGEQLWALGFDFRHVRRFAEGRFQTSFPLDSFNYYYGHPTSNRFAATDDWIVIPAHPSTGALAALHRPDGALARYVGEPLAFDAEMLQRLPGLNDSYWLTAPDGWISVHKFFPMVTFYNRDFEPLRQVEPRSPVIQELSSQILDFTPSKAANVPPALITDAKLHRGKLFLMADGRLHRMSLEDGRVTQVAAFYGEGEDFAEVTEPFVYMYFFAFLADDTLIVAHPGMMWNHPLWRVDLPVK